MRLNPEYMVGGTACVRTSERAHPTSRRAAHRIKEGSVQGRILVRDRRSRLRLD